ncbi:MAG: radical SAM protein [Syntrophales bacterium]
MVKILVINVSLRPNSPVKIFPVGLGYITTAMKNAGIDFDLLDIDAYRYTDAEVERLIRKKHYDVVCMGCIVTGYKIIKELCEVIKDAHPDCTIIVGNSVASSIVDVLLTGTRADIAVKGEGDETIVELLSTLSHSGNIDEVSGISFRRDEHVVHTSPRSPIKNISTLPFIDYSIFDVEIYIANAPMQVSDPLPLSLPREDVRMLPVNSARGCIARCTFCYHVFNGMPYRFRSVESIIAEISFLTDRYKLNYIMFSDELTFFSKKRALEFSEAILKSGLHFYWVINCRPDLFDRDEDIGIIRKIKQAGCISVGYSLESADPDILIAMNKKSTIEQFSRQTRLFHQAGMPILTSLVFGFPQETPETIRKTIDCCIENRIYPSTGYLLPQPGSKMYDYALANGFITDEEQYLMSMGDRQDLILNMTCMSDEEFEKCVWEGLKRCNKILKVGLDETTLIKTQYYRANEKTMDAGE